MITAQEIVEEFNKYLESDNSSALAIYPSSFTKLAKAIKDKIKEENKTTTCKNADCENYYQQTMCLKKHSSCCNLLYISNDYFKKG